MSTNRGTKINQLLQQTPGRTVLLASWLDEQGYSYDLQQRYLKSRWLEAVGRGAFKRKGDSVDIYGALYALQNQAGKNVHIGGKSSLILQGFAHYVEMQETQTVVFAPSGSTLPEWFLNNKEFIPPVVIRTNFLPPNIGLTSFRVNEFAITISNTARAMLECLEMAPKKFDLNEAMLIMEGLTALMPQQVQTLLEHCNSIKAKRLFLYLADKTGHTWFKHIQTDKIHLGSGKRSIVKSGRYIAKYQITVPESIV
jgi:hypothetical protein